MTSISRSFLFSEFFAGPLGITATPCLSSASFARHPSSGSSAMRYLTFDSH
jgi:hypothetical protein